MLETRRCLDAHWGVSFSLGAELRRWAWLIAASRGAASSAAETAAMVTLTDLFAALF